MIKKKFIHFIHKDFLLLTILFILILLVCLPFFKKGFFLTDDGLWAVIRMAEMKRELGDFQFPPRWSGYLNHGFGYPLFLFTYTLPYYLAAFFYLLTFSLVNAIKAVFVLSTFISIIGMYYLARQFWNRLGAFFCAAAYLFFPFRLVDLYVRGSIGETVAQAIFPLILLWSVSFLMKGEKSKGLLVCLSIAFLFLAHNASTILFFPSFTLFILFLYRFFNFNMEPDVKRQRLFYLVTMFFAGISLVTSFWLPALWERKYITASKISLAEKSENFVNLLISSKPAQLLGTRPNFQIGFLQLSILFLAFLYALLNTGITQVKKWKKELEKYWYGKYLIKLKLPAFNAKQKMLVYVCVLIVLIDLFSMTSAAHFLWSIPPLSWLDFPWRLLNIIGLFIVLPLGFIEKLWQPKFIALFMTGVLIWLYIPSVWPKDNINLSESYYSSNDATTTSKNELMPIWVKIIPTNRVNKAYQQQDGVNLEFIRETSKSLEFRAEIKKESEVVFNKIYFPGWKAYINEKPVTINIKKDYGFMSLILPRGNYLLSLKFGSTPIRIVADLISMVSFAVLFIYWRGKYFKN